MTSYGRWVYAINLPITLYLVLWIWLGRVPFGLTSWWVAIFPLTLGLIMVLCLRATIGIARSPRHPRLFDRDEANAHVVMWLTMGVFGLALVDGGRIVARDAFLIRPPEQGFEFTHIHGLRWEDVAGAPPDEAPVLTRRRDVDDERDDQPDDRPQ